MGNPQVHFIDQLHYFVMWHCSQKGNDSVLAFVAFWLSGGSLLTTLEAACAGSLFVVSLQ